MHKQRVGSQRNPSQSSDLNHNGEIRKEPRRIGSHESKQPDPKYVPSQTHHNRAPAVDEKDMSTATFADRLAQNSFRTSFAQSAGIRQEYWRRAQIFTDLKLQNDLEHSVRLNS